MANYYFVWVKSLRGLAPERWAKETRYDCLNRERPFATITPLPPDIEMLTLDQLAAIYPAPEKVHVSGP